MKFSLARKAAFSTFLLSLARCVQADADGSADSMFVHHVDSSGLESLVKGHDMVLAEFFAPWCGHVGVSSLLVGLANTNRKSARL